ncbi:GPP34 family phosphoprotein [Streptomyces sp. NPDC046866]|uniref:GPP34 family phosphoprotein n=1 Tax=Streptomyces sp. NPDC046866 TaxID=3154921 RepID=UPI00345420FD
MTAAPRLYALCALADGCFPPAHREVETGRGLVGALLVQGALAGRLELHRDRVRPTRHGPAHDPLLEAFLTRLCTSRRDRTPAGWARRLGPWALAAVRPGVAPAGRPVPGDRLGMQPAEALRRVRSALREPDAAAPTAVAVGALLAASGLHHLLLPGTTRAEAHRRTARAVGALGPAGVPAARAAAAVSDSLEGSAAALAFPG